VDSDARNEVQGGWGVSEVQAALVRSSRDSTAVILARFLYFKVHSKV